MKRIKQLCCFLFLGFSFAANGQEEVCYNPNQVKDTTKKSIKSMAIGVINGDTIRISYHSPGVRKRIIWGGLVPFDEVWVTGAHNATTVEFPKPVVISNTLVAPGKYAFFTIPGQEEWILILNKNWDQHLASEYDQAEDIIRITVKPKANPHTERLQYFIEEIKVNEAIIAVGWEKIRVELPFIIKK